MTQTQKSNQIFKKEVLYFVTKGSRIILIYSFGLNKLFLIHYFGFTFQDILFYNYSLFLRLVFSFSIEHVCFKTAVTIFLWLEIRIEMLY